MSKIDWARGPEPLISPDGGQLLIGTAYGKWVLVTSENPNEMLMSSGSAKKLLTRYFRMVESDETWEEAEPKTKNVVAEDKLLESLAALAEAVRENTSVLGAVLVQLKKAYLPEEATR